MCCSAHITLQVANEKGGNFDPETFAVANFVDASHMKTCRGGGGPARPGRGAPRNDPEIQQCYYNGWLRFCGVKWLSVDSPDGLTMFGFGVCSSRFVLFFLFYQLFSMYYCTHSMNRHNDLYLLGHCHLNAKLADLQSDEEKQFFTYGDSIFPYDTHLRGKRGGHGDVDDLAMSSCRGR